MKDASWVLTLAVLCCAAASSEEPANRSDACTVAEVARGSSWVSPYWGYNTPKIVFDGKAYYTAGLWGAYGTAEGVLYKFENGTWRTGATLPEIYQPATLLLDQSGRLIVAYTRQFRPFRLLRAREPGSVDAFDELPNPPGMTSAYYIGVAIQDEALYLAYIVEDTYTMYLAQLDLKSLTWTPPVVMQEGQAQSKPKTAWTYPVLIATAEGLHVTATNSPDGSEGNTYNKVWYLFYPRGAMEPSVRELVAETPMGHNSYAMDMAVEASGRVHVLFMWNTYKYGDPLPEGSPPPGTYHAWRDPATGAWQRKQLAPLCIAGFYQAGPHILAVTQENGGIVMWEWQATGADWKRQGVLCAREQMPTYPTFMDVIAPQSGSKPGGLAIVTDGFLTGPDGQPGDRVVWSILAAE